MKTRIRLVLILLLLAALAGACASPGNAPLPIRGSGNVVAEDRSVAPFNAIEIATIGDVIVRLGAQEALLIEGEDNMIDALETVVEEGTLVIRSKKDSNISPTRPIRYTVTARAIDALTVSSVGAIDCPALTADHFAATISSTGDIHLAGLTAGSLKVEITSTGSVVIDAGEVNSQEVRISSTGRYEGENVRSQTATVALSSTGNATVWVTEQLHARTSSIGVVRYYGKPQVTAESNARLEPLGDK